MNSNSVVSKILSALEGLKNGRKPQGQQTFEADQCVVDDNLTRICVEDLGDVIEQAKCFVPNTLVELENGVVSEIKDLDVGQKLKNGSVINSVMKLNNLDQTEQMYRIKNGVNGSDVFVSGSHRILNENNEYVKISTTNEEKVDIEAPILYSLITSDHKIVLGENEFHDFDDDYITFKEYFQNNMNKNLN